MKAAPKVQEPFAADQGNDPAEVIRLLHRGASAELQQEHGAAHLLAQGLAGEETTDRVPAADTSLATGGDSAEPALGYGPVPGMG